MKRYKKALGFANSNGLSFSSQSLYISLTIEAAREEKEQLACLYKVHRNLAIGNVGH